MYSESVLSSGVLFQGQLQGTDLNVLSDLSSGLAFIVGAGVPCLLQPSSRSRDALHQSPRCIKSSLLAFGAIGAWLDGANKVILAGHVLLPPGLSCDGNYIWL